MAWKLLHAVFNYRLILQYTNEGKVTLVFCSEPLHMWFNKEYGLLLQSSQHSAEEAVGK